MHKLGFFTMAHTVLCSGFGSEWPRKGAATRRLLWQNNSFLKTAEKVIKLLFIGLSK